jgi:hypothetical protein
MLAGVAAGPNQFRNRQSRQRRQDHRCRQHRPDREFGHALSQYEDEACTQGTASQVAGVEPPSGLATFVVVKRGGHQPAVAASDEPVQQLAKKGERHEQICPSRKLEQERHTQTQRAQNRHQDEPCSAT